MNGECGKHTSVYKMRAVRQVASPSMLHSRGISSKQFPKWNSEVTDWMPVKPFGPSVYSKISQSGTQEEMCFLALY